MNAHTPDRWVVVKITTPHETIHKVFATWYGGYAVSDSWQLNSGIESVTEDESYFMFKGYSGSVYACFKGSYGTSAWSTGVLYGMINNAKGSEVSIDVMPEDTDWRELFK